MAESNNGADHAFKVAVESILQRKIKEITNEEEVIYEEKKTPSQVLTDLAHRVDFSTESEEENDLPPPTKKKDSDKWTWESVHTKLNHALTEVSILSDLLQIVKQHSKYIALDQVRQQSLTSFDAKPSYQIVVKKKALGEAAEILSKGVTALKSEAHSTGLHDSDDRYLSALTELRKRWKLRRAANGIVVDVTFASAGSLFCPPSSYEITKGLTDSSSTLLGSLPKDFININLPAELQADSEILVFLSDTPMKDEDTMNRFLNVLHYPRTASLPSWEQRLLKAQNVIFNKELFTKLCHGIYNTRQLNVPFEMLQNQLHIYLRKNRWLTVAFVTKVEKPSSKMFDSLPVIQPIWELVVSLKKGLRQIHKNNSEVHHPKPATASFEKPEIQNAGVNALTKAEILKLQPEPDQLSEVDHQAVKLFEDFITQARHLDAFERVNRWVREVVDTCKDPLAMLHWEPDPDGVVTYGKLFLMLDERYAVKFSVASESVSVELEQGRTLTVPLVCDRVQGSIRKQVILFKLKMAKELALEAKWRVLSINPVSANVEEGSEQTALMLETTDTSRKVELLLSWGKATVCISWTDSTAVRGQTDVAGRKRTECYTLGLQYGKNFKEQFSNILAMKI